MLLSDSMNVLCSLQKCHFEIAVTIVFHSVSWSLKASPLNNSFKKKKSNYFKSY